MTPIQSEIRKSLLLLMLCTFVACIGFTAGMLSGIVSARLLTGLFAVYIVVSGIWFIRDCGSSWSRKNYRRIAGHWRASI
jgi:hypothetical protein